MKMRQYTAFGLATLFAEVFWQWNKSIQLIYSFYSHFASKHQTEFKQIVHLMWNTHENALHPATIAHFPSTKMKMNTKTLKLHENGAIKWISSVSFIHWSWISSHKLAHFTSVLPYFSHGSLNFPLQCDDLAFIQVSLHFGINEMTFAQLIFPLKSSRLFESDFGCLKFFIQKSFFRKLFIDSIERTEFVAFLSSEFRFVNQRRKNYNTSIYGMCNKEGNATEFIQIAFENILLRFVIELGFGFAVSKCEYEKCLFWTSAINQK